MKCTRRFEHEEDNVKMAPNVVCSEPSTPSSPTLPVSPRRPKSMMENLLVAKMEQVALSGHRQLVRSDSVDSNCSIGSVGSESSGDVCRCDDCILGIADLYAQFEPAEGSRRKKVKLLLLVSIVRCRCSVILLISSPLHVYKEYFFLFLEWNKRNIEVWSSYDIFIGFSTVNKI